MGTGARSAYDRFVRVQLERPPRSEMETVSYDDDGGRAGEVIDMSGRRVREPKFPRITRQSPIQRHFLKRLERLVLLSRYGQEHLVFSDTESALLKRSTYSVYRDCVDLGLQREAHAVLSAEPN
jgi:hypothetical protein